MFFTRLCDMLAIGIVAYIAGMVSSIWWHPRTHHSSHRPDHEPTSKHMHGSLAVADMVNWDLARFVNSVKYSIAGLQSDPENQVVSNVTLSVDFAKLSSVVTGLDSQDTCALCVADHVYDSIQDILTGWDARCKLPFKSSALMRGLCGLLRSKPDAFAGLVGILNGQPSSALWYCHGNGECKRHKIPEDGERISYSQGPLSVQGALFEDFLSSMAENEKRSETQNAHESGVALRKSPSLVAAEPDPSPESSCASSASNRFKLEVFHALEQACSHNPSDPQVASICSFMNQNEDLVFGALMGLMQPWKYVSGYCHGSRVPKSGEGVDLDSKEHEQVHDLDSDLGASLLEWFAVVGDSPRSPVFEAQAQSSNTESRSTSSGKDNSTSESTSSSSRSTTSRPIGKVQVRVIYPENHKSRKNSGHTDDEGSEVDGSESDNSWFRRPSDSSVRLDGESSDDDELYQPSSVAV